MDDVDKNEQNRGINCIKNTEFVSILKFQISSKNNFIKKQRIEKLKKQSWN